MSSLNNIKFPDITKVIHVTVSLQNFDTSIKSVLCFDLVHLAHFISNKLRKSIKRSNTIRTVFLERFRADGILDIISIL